MHELRGRARMLSWTTEPFARWPFLSNNLPDEGDSCQESDGGGNLPTERYVHCMHGMIYGPLARQSAKCRSGILAFHILRLW